jgi:histidyl-tRNA synthetase
VEAQPLIAVIPDNPSLEGEAINLAYRLRKEGFATTIAYKGNAKRHAEVARKNNADAALYIRPPEMREDGYGPIPRYHLTQLKPDPNKDFLFKVSEAIGPGLGGMSGEAPFA